MSSDPICFVTNSQGSSNTMYLQDQISRWCAALLWTKFFRNLYAHMVEGVSFRGPKLFVQIVLGIKTKDD